MTDNAKPAAGVATTAAKPEPTTPAIVGTEAQKGEEVTPGPSAVRAASGRRSLFRR